jgi:GAF domain-containing protein
MVTHDSTQLVQTDALSKERLHALYRTIERMNSVYELPDLLTLLLDQVLEDTHGQRGYLLLIQDPAPDDDEPRLEVKAVSGAGVDVTEVETDIYQLVSRTVVRDVLRSGEARITDDIGQDVRYMEYLGRRSSEHKWPSIVAIPLKVADRLIGLIYIEHPKPGAFFKPDLEFVSAFAAQAAVAVDRAQQSQRRVEELERLNEVSRSVVRVLDLDQVLVRIMREATHMLDVETGSVLLVDQGTGELVFRLSVQEGRPVHITQRLKVGQGVAGWVAEHGEPLLVPEVHHDPRWYGEVENGFATRSILCVPLKIDDHVIGVLQALNKKGPLGFTDRDLALLSAFATSATVAIENARLFAEARQARELRALNKMAAALGSTLELETVLEIGLTQVLDVMGVEAAAVGLRGDATGELAVAATQGWRGEGVPVGTHLPAGEGLSGQVATSGEVLVVDETTRHFPISGDPLYSDEGVRAVALAPMRVGGQVVGVLSAISYRPHTFTREEIEVLSAIGGMFGVAVENARLYEEVRSNLMQLAYFNEVGSALTASLDLEQVLQIIMEGVISLIGVERASIFLIDEASDDLVLKYSAHVREIIRLPAPWQGVVGWIATHGKPAIVNDVREDARFLPDIDAITQFDTCSILGAPLQVKDRTIGVVEVLNKLEGPFTENDRDSLVDFSKWAAIALHNARLYWELDEAKDRQASAEAVVEVGDMALNLTHELNNRIGIIPVAVSRIQAKCEDELNNHYLKEKLELISRMADESKTRIQRIRGPFEVADEEPLSVSECLAETFDGFQTKPGIKVVERYQPGLPPVMAAREKLMQAFCHIIGNALDALGESENGQLWLSTRRRLDGLVEVVIADDGPGIPPEILADLFAPGRTTKKQRGGLGLGLWWTHYYVRRLGGQVKLQSTPGQGTVVSIRLPAIQEEASS